MGYPTLLTILYFFFLFISFIYLSDKRNKHSKETRDIFVNICFFILLFVHFFKDYNGFSDLPRYIDGLHEVRQMSFGDILEEPISSFKSEYGFAVLMKLIVSVTESPLFFFFVTSSIILIGYTSIIRRYSVSPWFSILILLTGPYMQSLYVIRQYVAIAVCLLSTQYIITRKIVPFLLIVALAFSFHQTAIVFLPLYFLYGVKNEKNLSIILLVVLIVGIVSFQVVSLFIGGVLSGYESFLEVQEESSWHMALVIVSLLIIRMLVLKKKFFAPGIQKLLSIVLVLAIVVSVGGSSLEMIGRLNLYFTAYACLYVPSSLLSIKSSFLRVSLVIFYLAIFSYVFFSCLSWPSIESAFTYWKL